MDIYFRNAKMSDDIPRNIKFVLLKPKVSVKELNSLELLDNYLYALNQITRNVPIIYEPHNQYANCVSFNPNFSLILKSAEEKNIMIHETIETLIRHLHSHDMFICIYTFIRKCKFITAIADKIIYTYMDDTSLFHNKKDLYALASKIAEFKNGNVFIADLLQNALYKCGSQDLVKIMYNSIRKLPDHDIYFLKPQVYNLNNIVKWFAYDYEHIVDYRKSEQNRYLRYLVCKERKLLYIMYIRMMLLDPTRDRTLLDLNAMIYNIMQYVNLF